MKSHQALSPSGLTLLKLSYIESRNTLTQPSSLIANSKPLPYNPTLPSHPLSTLISLPCWILTEMLTKRLTHLILISSVPVRFGILTCLRTSSGVASLISLSPGKPRDFECGQGAVLDKILLFLVSWYMSLVRVMNTLHLVCRLMRVLAYGQVWKACDWWSLLGWDVQIGQI